jgi:hypothetical protein
MIWKSVLPSSSCPKLANKRGVSRYPVPCVPVLGTLAVTLTTFVKMKVQYLNTEVTDLISHGDKCQRFNSCQEDLKTYTK